MAGELDRGGRLLLLVMAATGAAATSAGNDGAADRVVEVVLVEMRTDALDEMTRGSRGGPGPRRAAGTRIHAKQTAACNRSSGARGRTLTQRRGDAGHANNVALAAAGVAPLNRRGPGGGAREVAAGFDWLQLVVMVVVMVVVVVSLRWHAEVVRVLVVISVLGSVCKIR